MKEELKTLKDIERYAPEDPYVEMHILERTTDKRTLNSKWYNRAIKRYVWIDESELRQKAIKWIKEWEHDHCDFSRGRQNALIIFLNITEEDLK